MQNFNVTQGDDWQIDWYLEELVGGEWVPVNITNITFAQAVRKDGYAQSMVMTKISTADGHVRASLAAATSLSAPVGMLLSNVQKLEGGLKTSSPPFVVTCVEDFTL